jgi:cysteine desulfurase/selenocysteine lyase
VLNNNNNKFNPDIIRKDFPILDQEINGAPLAYLDNAASTQKPKAVIDAICNYYNKDHSNVHRGVHTLSVRATELYEQSRSKIAQFINANSSNEIVFTRGTTESINILASSLSKSIGEGDEILISTMEHHSNIVPWQELSLKTGANLKVIPINELGEIKLDHLEGMLNDQTKLISITHTSNTLGTINPIKEIIKMAHLKDTKVIIDGAQAIAHQNIDVQDLDCDFYAFSGHKLYGPTGIGVLYGKENLLNELPPYQFGGEMILQVTFEHTSYNSLPYKFEAGTPNIAGSIGLGSAIDYLESIPFDLCQQHEMSLHNYALEKLKSVDGLQLIGESSEKSPIISFIIENIHPHDIGTILNQKGVAVRTGHHCTMPLMDYFSIAGTIRASFSFYNTIQEIDQMIDALDTACKMLA